MDVLIKAKELGEILAETEELKRLKNAEAVLESDENAKKMMEELRFLQTELARATADNSDADIKSIRELLKAKQEEINKYPVTKDYIEAKKAFDELVKNINDIISFELTGEVSTALGYSSCGGCGACSSRVK